jgi:putative hydrolase of the HAD superfamily
MAGVQAVLFDYGDTLCALGVAQARIGEAYGQIRSLLAAQTGREVPEIPQLVQGITVRVIKEVGASYKRREPGELDMVELFDNALRDLDLAVPRPVVEQICGLEYRAMVSERTVPTETLTTLAAMRERGLKLGIVSNAHFIHGLMLEHFDALGLTALVDVVVTSAEFGLRKPHPEIFRAALARLGVGPQDALFVGDKVPEDIAGPHRIGMRAALTHQFQQEEPGEGDDRPDLVVNSLVELLPWLDRANA